MNHLFLYLSVDGKDVLLGKIFFEYLNGQEKFSFEYDDSYLSNKNHIIIDPSLFIYSGRQYGKMNFLQDMIPDRFGQFLINKDEEYLAIKEKRLPKKLNTYDYLTRVNDLSRMGALRIKKEKDGPFINDQKDSIPPYIYLREIEQASSKIENINDIDNKTLKKLLLPGSSLGGARPKCNIYFNDDVYIAKFPSQRDRYDVELLEFIALKIAKCCGLNVPECKLEQFSELGHTLLVKRFDREKNERIHYLSAVNALEANDGESSEYSYIDLATFIRNFSFDINDNLKELFKRMVLTFLINNTDNHLRNHAFLLKDNKYILSPLFDINPSIYESDFELKFGVPPNKEGIIEIAKYFNLSKDEATKIYEEIAKIVLVELNKYKSQYSEISKQIEKIQNIIKTRL